jgi:hypothetical protein
MPRLSSVAPPDPVAAVVVALSVAAMAATPLAPGWLLPVPAATIVVGTAAVDVAPFTGHGHGCSASSTQRQLASATHQEGNYKKRRSNLSQDSHRQPD